MKNYGKKDNTIRKFEFFDAFIGYLVCNPEFVLMVKLE